MKKWVAAVLCVCMLLCITGCEKETLWKTTDTQVEHSAFFADDVNKLMPKNENYMFSPLSIQSAFAMVANGAQDETRQEILDALGIQDLEVYNQRLEKLLEIYKMEELMQLHLANGVWVLKEDATVSETYAERMRTYYNAPVATVPKNSAVQEINKWVRDNTNGEILFMGQYVQVK